MSDWRLRSPSGRHRRRLDGRASDGRRASRSAPAAARSRGVSWPLAGAGRSSAHQEMRVAETAGLKWPPSDFEMSAQRGRRSISRRRRPESSRLVAVALASSIRRYGAHHWSPHARLFCHRLRHGARGSELFPPPSPSSPRRASKCRVPKSSRRLPAWCRCRGDRHGRRFMR